MLTCFSRETPQLTLSDATDRGYIVVSDELEYGATSIACPLVLPGIGVIGAINSSAASSRVDSSIFAESWLPHLLAATSPIDGCDAYKSIEAARRLREQHG